MDLDLNYILISTLRQERRKVLPLKFLQKSVQVLIIPTTILTFQSLPQGQAMSRGSFLSRNQGLNPQKQILCHLLMSPQPPFLSHSISNHQARAPETVTADIKELRLTQTSRPRLMHLQNRVNMPLPGPSSLRITKPSPLRGISASGRTRTGT